MPKGVVRFQESRAVPQPHFDERKITMAKIDEINYVRHVASVEGIPEAAFRQYLANKPFSDPRCGEYLIDLAQIMKLLPPPPKKLLDVGVGSGWTSALFALQGYEVLGLDISPDFVELANQRGSKAKFAVCDYETGQIPREFDIAVIYDSLHHAENEASVIGNIYNALSDGGILITIEPGAGHSTSPAAVEVMHKYGTTEKDMPFKQQQRLMKEAGFGIVEQYTRVSQLPIENIENFDGALKQVRHGLTLAYGSATGFTSIVLARKVPAVPDSDGSATIAKALMSLAMAHDEFVHHHDN
jgi:2-polyprenyl-3-methyl-5-hydroxy-6-metoxy-1,4-benzoquinol methylase